jgi:probable phosphoglycerate mutase
MKLYIVRHGTTDWNADRRFQGSQDIELNQEGRRLASELGKRFDSEGTDFDIVYSSPLIRAYETACLIRGHKTYPIIRNDLLRELSFGTLEGMSYKDWTDTDHPRKYFFTEPNRYVPPAGGETLESVCGRTKEFVQTVLEPLQEQNPSLRVLLVAHGALLAAMTCYLDKHGTENFWGTGLKGNCEETIYSFDGRQWTQSI